MLWVSSKSFGLGFSQVLAVAACTVVSGCFLDETPRGATSTSSSTSRQPDAGRRGFVPRDPGPVRTQDVDAAVTDAGSRDPIGPVLTGDASLPTMTPRMDAQVPTMIDAQVAPMIDAQVPAADAGTAAPVPTLDAQVAPIQDAAPPAIDAQVMPDAGPTAPPPLPQPIHRYAFEGSGRMALDSIGDAHAELQGRAFLADMGEVQLGGTYEDAVVLPPRILAGVTSFTMLGWMVPRTQECTQRLFEFIYFRENQQRTQVSALYLAPYACPDARPALGYLTEMGLHNIVSDQPLNGPREQVLLGAMYDADTEELQLIVDGVVVQRMSVPLKRRELTASQGSLGRSSPEGEPSFGSTIAEFRIYDQTLDDATLAEIARRGPDQL